MLSPKESRLGKVLDQYVLVRITRMDNVDLTLFDHDRNNTLYFYILNADEHIYMRYGGRDSQSPDSYLNIESIELAARKGLELHQQYKAGKIQRVAKGKSVFPKDYSMLVERTFARNQCVECHLIADYQNLHREKDGTLDKLVHLYRSPDIKTIGVFLDVPKGLLVKEAKGVAADAGMKAGDTITAWNGVAVHTFADLQLAYDRLDRKATQVRARVEREGKPVELTLALPARWWQTDVRWRQSSVDPRVYFDSKPLTPERKKQLGLNAAGFASEVSHVDMFAEITKSHTLKVGDVVYSVDGAETDEVADTAELHIRLRKKAGDSMKLGLIRGGKKMDMQLNTFRMAFRK